MNFLNLAYFHAIARAGSISGAAKEMYISQQSMSAQLKKLEEHFGTPLFYRTTPLTLTPAGARLLHGAEEILDRYPVRSLSIQYRRNRLLSSGAELFIETAKAFFRK